MKLTHRDAREKFRRQLVNTIFGQDDDCASKSRSSLIGELELSKYNYYIAHGVETEKVAPLEMIWIKNMLSLLTSELRRHRRLVEHLVDDIKDEYLMSVKKAIVDFTLKLDDESKEKLESIQTFETSREEVESDDSEPIFKKLRKELSDHLSVVPKPWKRNFDDVHHYMETRLFPINPTISQVFELWQNTFQELRLVDNTDIIARREPFTLQDFHSTITKHVQHAKDTLDKHWFQQVVTIFYQDNKKPWYPSMNHLTRFEGFLNCAAELMKQQLEQLSINSLKSYSEIFSSPTGSVERYQHPGFIIKLILKDDQIIFEPTLQDIETVFTEFSTEMLESVKKTSRIESKLYSEYKSKRGCLVPEIPVKYIKECKNVILKVLHAENSGPRKYLTKFDKYMELITGQAEEEVSACLSISDNESMDFQTMLDLVTKYQNMYEDIRYTMETVETVGMFEIVSDELAHALINRADGLKTRLLHRAKDEHLSSMKSIIKDYNGIARKALQNPTNTDELMKLQEYVQDVKTDEMMKINSNLMKCQQNMAFLLENTTLSPIDLNTGCPLEM